jgi:hypothetical protein
MAILPEPVRNPHSDITKKEAQEFLNTGTFGDPAALALCVQDAERAEQAENAKNWILAWTQSRWLYESPYAPRYWPGTQIEAASIPFFTLATAVNGIVPQVMAGLFYETPPFMVQERPGTSAQAARAVAALQAYQLDDIDFRQEIQLGVHNCLIFGTSMFQWGWEKFTRERRIVKRKDPAVILKSTIPGAPDSRISNGELEEQIVEEVVDRPTFEHIENLREVLVDPGLQVPDVRKAKYVCRRRYMTWNDLDKLRDRPGYDIPPREKLLELFMPPQEPVESDVSGDGSRNPMWEARGDPGWAETTADPFQKPLEVLERWDNNTYIVVLQKKVVIFNDKNEYGKIPFLSIGWWRIPGSFWCLGLGRTIGSEQRLQTGITHLVIDNASLALNAPLVRVRGKNVPTQSIRIGPGKIIEVDAQGDLAPLMRSAPVPEAGELLAMSQGRADTVSGANPITSMGQAGAAGHSNLARSSAGASALASGANNPIADFVDKLADQVIVPYLYEVQEMNRSMLPESQLNFILSDELKHVYLDEEGQPGDLVDILNARVKFNVLAGSKMQTRRNMAQALPMITQFLANPSLIQQLSLEGRKVDINELIRVWFEMAEMRNEHDIIVPMTPQDLERQQQQSQGGVIQQKTQAQSQLEQQKFIQKQQLADQENVARAARDVLREGFKKAVEPQTLTGLPSATTGFGSLI